MPPDVTCEECVRRLPHVADYRIGKPIILTPVLHTGGHAMYRHQSGGAISLCLAPASDRLTADQLRERRLALGLSQPEFAEVCGVSERQVIRWERGHTRVPAWVPAKLVQRTPSA